MNKKELVESIRAKLNELGVSKDGCYDLNLEISKGKRISWVSRNQVMISTQIMGSLWRNKRYPIYSKTITYLLLVTINSVLNE